MMVNTGIGHRFGREMFQLVKGAIDRTLTVLDKQEEVFEKILFHQAMSGDVSSELQR